MNTLDTRLRAAGTVLAALFVCACERHPERAAAATPVAREQAASIDPAVPGAYVCDESHWSVSAGRMEFQPRGSVTLRPDGSYDWLDDGGSGRFRFDPEKKQITWESGPLAEKRPERTTFRLNERTAQIDIRLTEGVEWSCGRNL